MRVPLLKTWAIRSALVLVFIVGSIFLVSAPGPTYSIHDKAYYADQNLVDFVRPGLKIQIESASIAADGTISTQFKLTDPNGLPLDREGVYTPGAVTLRFIAAYIPKGQEQYSDYITRQVTDPQTGATAVQTGDETNGTYTKISDGEYKYTFATKAPPDFDKTVTNTIGITASRDLTEFDLGTDLADATFDFVPNGSQFTTVRELIETVSCDKCHQALSAHGETGRISMDVCVLCHQPQNSDPYTGHSLDMKVMIHKIHMGEQLSNKPYIIIGYRQSVNNFSDVVFPADPRNCSFCHEPGPPQADYYLTKPTMEACGACHDNVNFATGQNHPGGPQISNNLCAGCHIPQGELPFDASIIGAHTIPRFAPGVPGVVFELVKVDNGVAGQKPTVTFTLKDKSGNPILPSNMSTLNLSMAGPTTDYASVVTDDARSAQGTSDGTYIYTFNEAIPADAKGTYAIGIEGRRNVTLLQGKVNQMTVRDAGVNKVIYFSVDGSPIVPRRTVVSLDITLPGGPSRGCNLGCHYSLSLHGDLRNQPEYCVFCHNPNGTDVSQRPADKLPPQSIDFDLMVHKIHTGVNLVRDYTIYGFNGSVNTFNDVLFPGDRRRCDWCHVDDSQQVPTDDLLAQRLQVQDPRGLLNPVRPITAACTACHGEVHVASHALAQTTTLLGESCRACHGPDADFSVNKIHAEEIRVSPGTQ